MSGLERYEGKAVAELIAESVPWASRSGPYVFLMGPYRLLDPSYLYSATDHDLPADPLAPATGVDPDSIEATLRTVCERVSAETPAAAFIASDVDSIPTRQTAAEDDLDEPGMAVIDQSVAFAAASAGNAFVFTKAGLTTGVGAEAGAIPEYFRLRSPDRRERDPRTFCLFAEGERDDERNTYDPVFASASIDEMDDAYDLRFRYFESRDVLVEKLVDFVESYVVPLA